MADNVNPTRMELLKTKNRIKLARKGHKLLKQKRDFLVMEFLHLLEEKKLMRENLNKKLKSAYGALAVAESYHNIFELESAAQSVTQAHGVSLKERNIMGVRLPVIKKFYKQRTIGQRGYTIVGSSARIER